MTVHHQGKCGNIGPCYIYGVGTQMASIPKITLRIICAILSADTLYVFGKPLRFFIVKKGKQYIYPVFSSLGNELYAEFVRQDRSS